MNSKFTIGAISGITAVLVAVPTIAQFTSAQEATSSTSNASIFMDKVLTADHVQDMIDRDTAFLDHVDEIVSLQKSAITARKAALTAAASISDATERQAAVRAAMEAYRKAIDDAVEANPELKDAMHFGFMMKGHHGGPGGHHGPGHLAEKLGMTPEELKAAIESGKTIEEIAEEKGIELPAHPPMNFFFKRAFGDQESSDQ